MSASSVTTISRSTDGAAPTSATSSTSTRIFPNAAVVRLEENYRSTPQILDLANVVISENTGRMGKTLRATRPGGETITVVRSLDERDEADFVVGEMMARRSAATSLRLNDIAILYRTNAQSRALEEALRRHAVPYRLVGAVRFYDRREIRDLMAYLKLIANPSDDEAFRRAVAVPKRGLGETTIELLAEASRATRGRDARGCAEGRRRRDAAAGGAHRARGVRSTRCRHFASARRKRRSMNC